MSALNPFCAALKTFFGASAPLDPTIMLEGLAAAAAAGDLAKSRPDGLCPTAPWRAMLIPLPALRKQVLMLEDGRQQLQLEFDLENSRARGTWMDHADPSGVCCVLFTVWDSVLQTHFPASTTLRLTAMEPAPREMWEFVARRGPKKGSHFILGERARIGRNYDNEIVVPDNSISRYHAAVEHRGGAFWMCDTQSLNGVLVNGVKIDQPVRLSPGDVVEVCESEFVFQRAGDLPRTFDANKTVLSEIKSSVKAANSPRPNR